MPTKSGHAVLSSLVRLCWVVQSLAVVLSAPIAATISGA